MQGQTRPALAVAQLSKTFNGVRVLDGVSLDVRRGEVHALLGQNGSGKSTLIKCLAGVYRPDHGSELEIAGRPVRLAYPPSGARSLGLAFVHQDLGLIDDMTVAENLALGVGFSRRGGLISWREQRRAARRALDLFGLDVSPDAMIRDVPVTVRTLLAISRALLPPSDAGAAELACLVLDEPTASLPDQDAEQLFDALRHVQDQGVGIVYVSHRLDEIFRLADRATVLRNGASAGTFDVAALDESTLVDHLIGGEVSTVIRSVTAPQRAARDTREVLELSQIAGARINGLSMSVAAGEIVGVAGLGGSGRSELARLISGAQERVRGTLRVKGTTVASGSVRAAIDAGIGLVPEERRRDGCVLTMSVAENMTLLDPPTSRSGLLDLRAERASVERSIEDFDVRPRRPDTTVGTMSGGNQQKVVLAKWLRIRPDVLVLDEPVQGVDVGAKADIFWSLRQAADLGMAMVVIDSDFENLANLCDRVVVLRDGRIADELTGEHMTPARMSRATFGVADPSTVHHPTDLGAIS